jgi:3-hydroxyisobutyrate dehydrogenase
VAEGRATYRAGGPSADVDRLQPVLESLSDSIKRFDRPEQAGAAKLASNLLLLGSIAILAEAAAAGRAGGLSDDQLSQLFGDSPILGPGVKNRVEAVITGQGPTWWTVALGEKDVRLLLEMAGAGPGLRVSPVVCDVYRAAAEAGFADDDVAAVGRLFR